MKTAQPTTLITSALAGSLGAIIVLCLFYAFPVVAQEKKKISANEFLLVMKEMKPLAGGELSLMMDFPS